MVVRPACAGAAPLPIHFAEKSRRQLRDQDLADRSNTTCRRVLAHSSLCLPCQYVGLCAFATFGRSHTVRGHCTFTDDHPHIIPTYDARQTSLCVETTLSHVPRPNQVTARRIGCRCLQHVRTTDLQDYATPGMCWWECAGEIRWTASSALPVHFLGGPLRLAGRNTTRPGGIVVPRPRAGLNELPAGVRQTLFLPAKPGAGGGG